MSESKTKSIFIRAQDLGVSVTLTLAFTNGDNRQDWADARFGATGYYWLEGDFKPGSPAFTKSLPGSHSPDSGLTYVPIDFRHKTTLTREFGTGPFPTFVFSVPELDENLEADEFEVINGTQISSGVEVGIASFSGPVTRPPSILSKETVISSIKATLNPTIALFVEDVKPPTRDSKPKAATPVWSSPASELAEASYYVLTYASGQFTLNRDNTKAK